MLKLLCYVITAKEEGRGGERERERPLPLGWTAKGRCGAMPHLGRPTSASVPLVVLPVMLPGVLPGVLPVVLLVVLLVVLPMVPPVVPPRIIVHMFRPRGAARRRAARSHRNPRRDCPARPFGQFSKFHVCFCGLDPGDLKFETVRTNKQHICF